MDKWRDIQEANKNLGELLDEYDALIGVHEPKDDL